VCAIYTTRTARGLDFRAIREGLRCRQFRERGFEQDRMAEVERASWLCRENLVSVLGQLSGLTHRLGANDKLLSSTSMLPSEYLESASTQNGTSSYLPPAYIWRQIILVELVSPSTQTQIAHYLEPAHPVPEPRRGLQTTNVPMADSYHSLGLPSHCAIERIST
jgi:hypothetical protein